MHVYKKSFIIKSTLMGNYFRQKGMLLTLEFYIISIIYNHIVVRAYNNSYDYYHKQIHITKFCKRKLISRKE